MINVFLALDSHGNQNNNTGTRPYFSGHHLVLNSMWPSDALQWRHNERDGISIHQPHDCLLNRLFRHKSKKTSKLHVTGLCAGNSPGTGEFPTQMASYTENVSIWWRHHGIYASVARPPLVQIMVGRLFHKSLPEPTLACYQLHNRWNLNPNTSFAKWWPICLCLNLFISNDTVISNHDQPDSL